jgi:deoxyribose-phosphate aldolase
LIQDASLIPAGSPRFPLWWRDPEFKGVAKTEMKELALTRFELQALVAAMAHEISAGKPGLETGLTRPERVGGADSGERFTSSGRRDRKSIPMSSELACLAKLFDHTLLKPEATISQVEQACDEALQLACASLVVHPAWVSLAAGRLHGSSVKVGTVVGFPCGAEMTSAKRAAADAAIRAGAREIDMVMNVGAFLSGDSLAAAIDIRGVVEVGHDAGAGVKVILENALLNDEQKIAACRMVKQAGADFVKTSTGFGTSGATEGDVRLMRETLGPEMGIKAAGGIRTLDGALKMLRAGANRLGTSATVSILAQASERLS